MAEANIQSRLGALEAHKEVSDERWDDIKDYIQSTATILSDVRSQLGLLVKGQGEFETYRARCDDERSSLDKRLTEAEGFQRRQVRAAIWAAGAISLAISGGGKAWDFIKGLFNVG